ncbi:hypothetical protein TTHERM_01100380 (macronuclear) [Tetrahymena thermophila SB210]|uniref:Uncharacterized protein n=1 Tax=Tetrahymena thermophila (strain SB210) TaxID=312017 RepID=Q22BH4_TETTS|nr:hypothetical protein TTHERM_01100380 [Tetrahymena thermophila SB210]EAR82630.2 hypothetical protein TTHERM_01100380 [Tetrahymena thermophila SB210]|eukprot:XP_001030293.2 hypothetical protein TTHERM_01100380 [Tetrahymena thermophila SB210]
MSAQNSHHSSPKNDYENIGQQNDHVINYRNDSHQQELAELNGHTDNTPGHNNIHEQQRQLNIPLGQHNHLTEPVEQLINQQIPSEDLQPNNLYVGNPLLDSQYQNPPPNPLANAPGNAGLYNSQAHQITFAGVPSAAPLVLQSRTIISPAKLSSSQAFLQRGALLSPGALAKSKKLETQVKYEPYEKTVIQYEEVEKTIIEYQPVEKKIKVKIPVEKKVTDYRKCEYLVPANQEEDEEQTQSQGHNIQAGYPVYSRLLSSSKRTYTSPVVPLQSRLLTSTINFKPVNTLGQSTVLLQSQVVRSPVVLQQQQQQVRLNSTVSNVVSPKAAAVTASKGVTPKNVSGAVSPKGAQQFFAAQSKSQQIKQVSVPLQQSVSYSTSLVRTQPILARYAPVSVISHQSTLSGSTYQKPSWGYFNDRIINNSKIIRQPTHPYFRVN